MSKEEKVKILAEKLNNILPLLDAFMNSLNEEDFELLKESKEVLQDKISINNGALVLINACGGDYDDTEDRMKIKTIDCLIDLLKARKEYKEKLIEKQKENENKQEVLKLFGLMGM